MENVILLHTIRYGTSMSTIMLAESSIAEERHEVKKEILRLPSTRSLERRIIMR